MQQEALISLSQLSMRRAVIPHKELSNTIKWLCYLQLFFSFKKFLFT